MILTDCTTGSSQVDVGKRAEGQDNEDTEQWARGLVD
jgi:hypothetical protein